MPDAELADCTVWFAGSKDATGAVVWEGLLARRLANDRARICAVPIWTYDVNLGDEVEVMESGEGAPVAVKVLTDAGNFTFRVAFEPPACDDDRRQRLMVELELYECWFDIASPGLAALSASAEHAQAVADYLWQRQERGEVQYEAGRTRQP
jgi:hypothetical protein